jgi:hypothetical protein
LIIWAWGALEADFHRFYDMDLNFLHTNNKISWRKFLLLIRGLPNNSAYASFLTEKENRNMIFESDINKEISSIKGV